MHPKAARFTAIAGKLPVARFLLKRDGQSALPFTIVGNPTNN